MASPQSGKMSGRLHSGIGPREHISAPQRENGVRRERFRLVKTRGRLWEPPKSKQQAGVGGTWPC